MTYKYNSSYGFADRGGYIISFDPNKTDEVLI
jgi:hypothetical protein